MNSDLLLACFFVLPALHRFQSSRAMDGGSGSEDGGKTGDEHCHRAAS